MENHLQIMRRHVVEGRRRIRRQSCLVTRLHRNRHCRMLPEAEHFLARLVLVQATFEERLLPAARDFLAELRRYQESVKTCRRQLG